MTSNQQVWTLIGVAAALFVLLFGNNIVGRLREWRLKGKQANPEADHHRQLLEVQREQLQRQKEADEKEARRKKTKVELEQAKKQLEPVSGIDTLIKHYHDATEKALDCAQRMDSGKASLDDYQKAMKTWRFRIALILHVCQRTVAAMTLERFQELKSCLSTAIDEYGFKTVIGRSAPMEAHFSTIQKLHNQAKQQLEADEEAYRQEFLI